MKTAVFVAASALAVASFSGAASAQTYVEVTGAVVKQPDLGWGDAFFVEDYEMDTGSAWSLAVGRFIRPNIALEAEVTRTKSEYACCAPNSLEATAYIANAFYRFTPERRIRPYVGLGAGMIDVEYDAGGGASDTVFGWQAMAGVEIPLTPSISGFTEYRYQSASDLEDSAFAGGLTWEYESHNLGLGLRYTF